MSFYFFRLDGFQVKSTRSKGNVNDVDVIIFGVLVNQLEGGRGTATFPAFRGAMIPAATVPANNRKNISKAWEVGPLEIAPADTVHVVYSGTNIADAGSVTLDTEQQDKIQLKIMNIMFTAATGALVSPLGPVGAAIGAALGAIADPVGTILGFEPPARCNGLVFSDAVSFGGAGLDSLAMTPVSPPGRSGRSFTRNHTDAATHDTEKCGDLAETDVTFSVLRAPFISVRSLVASRFPGAVLSAGLRRLGQAGASISIKSLLAIKIS